MRGYSLSFMPTMALYIGDLLESSQKMHDVLVRICNSSSSGLDDDMLFCATTTFMMRADIISMYVEQLDEWSRDSSMGKCQKKIVDVSRFTIFKLKKLNDDVLQLLRSLSNLRLCKGSEMDDIKTDNTKISNVDMVCATVDDAKIAGDLELLKRMLSADIPLPNIFKEKLNKMRLKNDT